MGAPLSFSALFRGGGGASIREFLFTCLEYRVTIGEGRFRIFGGGQGLEYWGVGQVGGKFPAGT